MSTKDNEKKKGGIVDYFKSVRGELKKVTWPNREELKKYTIVVLFMVFFSAVVIGLLDAIFGGAFQLLA